MQLAAVVYKVVLTFQICVLIKKTQHDAQEQYILTEGLWRSSQVPITNPTVSQMSPTHILISYLLGCIIIYLTFFVHQNNIYITSVPVSMKTYYILVTKICTHLSVKQLCKFNESKGGPPRSQFTQGPALPLAAFCFC
jgi:hypothetical protein